MAQNEDDPLRILDASGDAAEEGAPASGGDQGQSSEGDASRAASGASGEVEVEWDGAKRKMSISDLVTKARQAEEAEERARVAQGMLRENEQVNMLKDFLEQLDPMDQATLRRFMANPREFRGGGQRQDAQERDQKDDDQPSETTQLMTQLGNAVQYLLEREQAREQVSKRTSLEERVANTMSGFEVFQGEGPKRDYAFQAIMNELSLNPDTKLDDLVARHATTIQKAMLGVNSPAIPASAHVKPGDAMDGVFRRSAPETQPSPTELPDFSGSPKTLRDARKRAEKRLEIMFRRRT